MNNHLVKTDLQIATSYKKPESNNSSQVVYSPILKSKDTSPPESPYNALKRRNTKHGSQVTIEYDYIKQRPKVLSVDYQTHKRNQQKSQEDDLSSPTLSKKTLKKKKSAKEATPAVVQLGPPIRSTAFTNKKLFNQKYSSGILKPIFSKP